MPDLGPVWTVVAIVMACLGLYGTGYLHSQRRNGYVRRTDCHRHVDDLRKSVEHTDQNVTKLFERVDDNGKAIARIEGKLE